MTRQPRTSAEKTLAVDAAVATLGRPRTGTLVFTNGVFDMLHAGHVATLTTARSLGDALIVAVNSDESVRRLGKGPERPVNDESARVGMLAALECVDHVCLFDADTPETLIDVLLPDVLVKGADYDIMTVVGRRAVEVAGGRVVLVPLVPGYSTTEVLERLRSTDPARGSQEKGDG